MNTTREWHLYQAGKNYNNKLTPNYYQTVNTNLEFMAGNQWLNADLQDLPKPVFNILKRVGQFQVASLTANKSTVQFEPLAYKDDDEQFQQETNAAEIATAEVKNLFEKFSMDTVIRDICFDAFTIGDGCVHFLFNPDKKPYGGMFGEIMGEIELEIIDGNNVYFGNSNNANVEVQPYVIVVGRDMVENLKTEAKQYKQNEMEITSDSDYEEQAGEGGKIEVEIEGDNTGKATYIIIYKKQKGTVHATKCTEGTYIYKDINTGLKHYPIAWMNWEKQKNQYHGRAAVTGLLPNQIFINRMFAMVMYHLMMSAFPKAVYNADYINGWSNQIGTAIPVRNMGDGFNVNNMAGYLQPGEMSNQIQQIIEMAMQYTKETMGISDAALGNIDPKNTSAIIAVQKSAAIPLENPKANLYKWLEDIAKILLDMMSTYYGKRPIVVEREGQKYIENFDFSIFKNLWLNTKVDVGSTSYWSEISILQTMDNLLNNNRIEFIDYLERIPDEYIPRKTELISKLKEMQEMQAQQMETENQMEQMRRFMETLPPEEQQRLMSLPDEQMEQELMAMMGGG